jgi:uncharacterized membrane protein
VLSAIGLVVLLVLVGAPLAGRPPVVRLPAVLVPALVLSLLVTRPWRLADLESRVEDWQPSARLVWMAAAIVFGFLFWYVLTRFQSGQINAIDFSVYYDRPCFQTIHGRPLFVEVSDTPSLSYRTELADHAYWGMLGVCSLYALHATPWWLHALSAAAVAIGAVQVLRILQHLRAGGLLACAGALAFVLNDNTARTLNYGFHPEILYACVVPWMLNAGLRGRRLSFLAATLACILVKEDACLAVLAASIALAFHRFRELGWRDRLFFLVLPPLAAIANLAVYYGWVLPFLTGSTRVTYAHFWANYGDTPMRALFGMCAHPRSVVQRTLTSGLARTLQPHLFLPLFGWRWTLGIVPIVVLYGVSANAQVRAFGIYYAIILVPFLVVGSAMAARSIARGLLASRPGRAQILAASAVLLGSLLVGAGSRGYSLRPWRPETAAVREALTRLGDEPVVLVQSGLFPHAPYDERFQLLTPETFAGPGQTGAALLLAPTVSGYPFQTGEILALARYPDIAPMPSTLLAVRRPTRQ